MFPSLFFDARLSRLPFRTAPARFVDKKLATAVGSERERILALKHKLEAAEDAARAATKAARAAAEGEASGRRAAVELAELAREQKVASCSSVTGVSRT